MQKSKTGKATKGGCSSCDSTTDNGLPFENMTDLDDKQQVFLTQLEEAVINGGTKNLWKKYGNRITMQFKDRNLEAKVCMHTWGVFSCHYPLYEPHASSHHNIRSLFRSLLSKCTTSVLVCSASCCSSIWLRP